MAEGRCRVWSKLDKRFYPVRSIIFDDKQNIERVIVLKEDKGKTYLHEILAPLFVLLHGTNLKDDNNKEIYEGDIVDFVGQTCEVAFDAGSFWLLCRHEIDYNATIREFGGPEDFSWYGFNDTHMVSFAELWMIDFNGDLESIPVKVLGNIYENKDLLEEL